MAWFYGTWFPNFMQNQMALGSYTFLSSGLIAHSTDHPDWRYRLVAEHAGYVVLLVRAVFPPDGRESYGFEYLRPDDGWFRAPDGGPGMAARGRCANIPNLREPGRDLLALPRAEIAALWAESYCNPAAGKNRASVKHPWGNGWGTEYMVRQGELSSIAVAKAWARKKGIPFEAVDWPHLPKQ